MRGSDEATKRRSDEGVAVARRRRGPTSSFVPRTAPISISNAGELTTLAPGRAEAVLPADLIRDDEIIILLLRPSLLYIPLTALGSLVVIALITFALAYLSGAAWVSQWVGWTDLQAFGLGLSLAALRLGWQTLEWWSRVYVLTDRRIIRRMGVLRVAVFQTELKNIQHTGVFRRLRERVFGLGSLGFATAGSDVFDAFWVMVGRPFVVHRIVNRAIERYR